MPSCILRCSFRGDVFLRVMTVRAVMDLGFRVQGSCVSKHFGLTVMAKKKGGNKKKQQQQQGLLAPLTSTSASNRPVWQGDYTPESLRQQQQGAARGGGSGQQHQAASSNPTAWMRAEHLMRLASWASTEVPPLGALLGMRVASTCQSAAFLPPDISPNVTCQWY